MCMYEHREEEYYKSLIQLRVTCNFINSWGTKVTDQLVLQTLAAEGTSMKAMKSSLSHKLKQHKDMENK